MIAVKDTWRLLPRADVIYGCDEHWWEHYATEIRVKSTAELWTQCADAARIYNLNRISGESRPGLGRKILHFGGNSGYQAVNLAFLFGAIRIILVGFDMQRTDNKVHFFGHHPYHRPTGGPNSQLLSDWCDKFAVLANDLRSEGVEVLNATRTTALTCFERRELEAC